MANAPTLLFIIEGSLDRHPSKNLEAGGHRGVMLTGPLITPAYTEARTIRQDGTLPIRDSTLPHSFLINKMPNRLAYTQIG